MSSNTLNKDTKTLGYVLRRTNYGEADRILNIITPEGKVSAIAKGVRREKSKLAGGIELFSLTELIIHKGRSELGTITSARMKKYYGNILKDFSKMELAALILKKISIVAESSDNPDFFNIVDQSLSGLDSGLKSELVESWFWLNLAKASGEEVNLYRDTNGKKLSSEERYNYNLAEKTFESVPNGELGAAEIKILRLMFTAKLTIVMQIKDINSFLPKILRLARMISGAV